MAKCIRAPRGSKSAHNLSRAIIETLPTQILSPVFVVNEWQRNSFAIITDYKDQNKNHMLIALKLSSEVQNLTVNEIVSFYGRNNLKVYLEKHMNEIHIIDNKKARSLASLLRLQLPTTLQVSDYENKISLQKENVNKNLSVREKLAEYEKKAHFRNADRECRQTQKEHPLEH